MRVEVQDTKTMSVKGNMVAIIEKKDLSLDLPDKFHNVGSKKRDLRTGRNSRRGSFLNTVL